MMMLSKKESPFPFSFLGMLLSFLAILIAAPLVEKAISSMIISIFLGFLLLFSVAVLSSDKKTLIAGIILGICSIAFLSIGLFSSSWWIYLYSQIAAALLIGLTIAVHFKKVFFLQEYNTNAVFGSVCVYLLLGLFFSLIYGMIEHISPGSFKGLDFFSNERSSVLDLSEIVHDFLYFSFVTQTTLGYGDVVPKIALAQNLAIIQAIMGQFYIAVLVAGIIGKIIRESEK